MKKQFFLLFALLSCFTSAWGGYDVNIDGIFYNLNRKDYTATVTYKYGPWAYGRFIVESYYEGNVVIPDTVTYDGIEYTVTSLGEYSFSNSEKLISITIPNTVTSLGNVCFRNCSGLTSITIPNSVTSLGYNCFEDCCSLTSVTIPNSLTSIGEQAFYNLSVISEGMGHDSETTTQIYLASLETSVVDKANKMILGLL